MRLCGANCAPTSKPTNLQFLLIAGVLALSTMLLTVSLLVMGSANEPWDRTFEATNGPHVWLVSHQYDLDLSVADPGPDSHRRSPGRSWLCPTTRWCWATKRFRCTCMPWMTPPPVAHPLVAEGRWLEPANPDEIVLDFSLAKFYDFQVGDTVTILGVDGTRSLQIVGLAVTAHWFPYNEITKDISPGVGYISQATLEALQPDPQAWFSVMGVRLKRPETSKEMVELDLCHVPREACCR